MSSSKSTKAGDLFKHNPKPAIELFLTSRNLMIRPGGVNANASEQ